MKKRIKLFVNGHPLQGRLTGVGYYTLSLLSQWQTLDDEFDITVVCMKSPGIDILERFNVLVEKDRLCANLKPVLWSRYIVPEYLSDCDVFWSPGAFLPLYYNPIVTVATVHDLNHIIAPATMPFSNRMAHRMWMRRDIHRADILLCNSFGTSARSKACLGREADFVVYPPVRSSITQVGRIQSDSILSLLGITGKFFLAVATQEPRKNLSLLVDAFARCKSHGMLADHQLILVGGAGWKVPELDLKIIKSADIGVISLGYITDDKLSVLYSNCTAFVFPSKYEGYGMPVKEAQRCGAPVIATDILEIREAAANEGTFIRPTVENLAQALLNHARNPLARINRSIARDENEFEAQFTRMALACCRRAHNKRGRAPGHHCI